MEKIKVLDKEFKLAISNSEIKCIIKKMAKEINRDVEGKNPIFLPILNGSFMFASDLLREIDTECRISFLKLSSYNGTSSSGKVDKLFGLTEDIAGKTVVVIEDIVDSGFTLDNILNQLKELNPAEIKVATLFYKPEICRANIQIDYIGKSMPNDFIVGYGLDYNGYGRNYQDVYTLSNGELKKQMKLTNVVLFGPPGAGKGTQAQNLVDKYGFIHISTGELLRKEIAAKTELGIEAQKHIDHGNLAPDHIVIGMLRSLLRKNKHREVKGYIFDGFPRNIKQAEELDKMLEEFDASVDVMLSLEVEKEELIKRLSDRAKVSGRADDQEVSVVETRINVYDNVTKPLIEFYKEQGKYRSIFGIGTIDEISERLYHAVDEVKEKVS